MDIDTIKKIVNTLNWKNLKDYLDAHPLKSMEDANQLFTVVYHSDRMVRRRATDDGKRRNKFLDSFTEYLTDSGYKGIADQLGDARNIFALIDVGYIAIFDTERILPTASWSGAQQVSSALTELSSALKHIEQDIDRSVEGAKELLPEQMVLDSEGNRYNPAGVFHNLAIAAGNILLMEAYRGSWFNDLEEVVIPELPAVNEREARLIVSNFATANCWQQWKAVDEKTRFLEGELRLIEGEPEWIGRVDVPANAQVKQALEFDTNIDAEVYCVLASERFDERHRQSYMRLMIDTNLSENIATGATGAAPSEGFAFISLEEGHASEILYQALSIPLDKAQLGDITVSELLRGYALLRVVCEQFYREKGELFPRFAEDDLAQRLIHGGLAAPAAKAFLKIAIFRRSSRDLYDAPLVRCADGSLMLFGWTTLHLDLPKVVLSSMSRQEENIQEKGSSFEKRIIYFFKSMGFDAKNIKVRRGPDNAVYDYDVVFTWDDYVFFFECKNRSLPGDNPIAIYYFNQSIESHVKQVQRLREGLETHTDILSEWYPSAVGKKRIFCVLHGLPFSRNPIDDIFFSDESLIKRFFESPSLGLTKAPLNKNSGLATTRMEFSRIWAGATPTADEFVQYLADPPQLRMAAAHFRQGARAQWLSNTVIAKLNYLHREGASIEQVVAAVKPKVTT